MVLLDELRVTMSDYQKDMDELYEVLGVAAAYFIADFIVTYIK